MENYNDPQLETPMTVGDWVVTLILSSIPIVGFVLLLVWAFGSSAPKNKSNWAKATLIMILIVFVLFVLWFLFMGMAMFASMSSYGY